MALLMSIVGAMVRTLVGPILAGLLVWGGGAFWLLSRDHGDFAARHLEFVSSLRAKGDQLHASMRDVDKRKVAIAEEIAAQEERAQQATKVIATLRDLESTWDRYVGNPAQQKANTEQIQKMEDMKSGAQAHAADLRREFRRKGWERDGLEIDLAKLEEQIAFANGHASRFAFYQDQAWRRYKWAILAAPVLYLLAAWIWRRRAFWPRIPEERTPRP